MVIRIILDEIRESDFPDLNKKEFNQLFAEALTMNLVQQELISMMEEIQNRES